MGLCPSRNTEKTKFVEGKTFQPQPAPASPTKLRADAAAFVPTEKEVPKEPWEIFLDQKKEQHLKGPKPRPPFSRRQDGTYTSDYRALLESTRAPRNPTLQEVQAATGAVNADVVKAWKDCAPKKPKPTMTKASAKKEPDAFTAALRKARQLPKEQALELLNQPPPQAKDDTPAAQNAQRCVPFGLTDRHYLSGDEDLAHSNVHRSLKPTRQREYVASEITAELEETMGEVLYKLRLLRTAEEAAAPGAQGLIRRYCVGLREVMRASKDPDALKAVLVAPDLEENSGRDIDQKLKQLLEGCKKSKIPVVFGLSRLRLGQAIKKNVTVSVMGILDTRGVQACFDRMLTLA